jgi:hypothetical protein
MLAMQERLTEMFAENPQLSERVNIGFKSPSKDLSGELVPPVLNFFLETMEAAPNMPAHFDMEQLFLSVSISCLEVNVYSFFVEITPFHRPLLSCNL